MDKVNAHLSFDYRGQTYHMSAVVNLDVCFCQSDGRDAQVPSAVPLEVLLDVPQLIAQANGVDVWSYEFEIMQQSDIWYDNGQGLAAACVHNGRFDLSAYLAARQQQVEVMLSPVFDSLRALAATGVLGTEAIGEVQQAVRHAWRQAVRHGWRQGYAQGRADAGQAARTPENR